MNHYINYANEKFRHAQIFSAMKARKLDVFKTITEYSPNDIDDEFRKNHLKILNHERGNGYWLWKPYLILKKLHELNDEDVLMYADSGSHFIRSPQPLLDLPKKYNQDVIPFELDHIEKFWTKRDAFILMECDEDKYINTKQRLASFVIIRKSNLSLRFATEYLTYCCKYEIISDDPNVSGYSNYEGFLTHRHDQSIFSLLTKKYNFCSFRDPSQWGNAKKENFSNSNYPQIINHTRETTSPKPKSIKKINKLIKKIFNFKIERNK